MFEYYQSTKFIMIEKFLEKSYRQKKKDCRLIVNRLWKRILIRIYFLKMFPNWNTYPDWVIVLYYLEIATEYLYKMIIRLNLGFCLLDLKTFEKTGPAERPWTWRGWRLKWFRFPLGNLDKLCVLSGGSLPPGQKNETALSHTTAYKFEKK